MKKISKILACLLLTCLLITQSLAYRYIQTKAIATEVIVLGGAALLSAAAFTYGYVVKNHDVVEQWADDFQQDMKNDLHNDWERMKKAGIISAGLIAEAGDYIKDKIIADRETVEQEQLADGIVAHSNAWKIQMKNYNYVRKFEGGETVEIATLDLMTPASKISPDTYAVAAGMFVEDEQLAEKLKYDGCVITAKPISAYVNSWVEFRGEQWDSNHSSGYDNPYYHCKLFESGSKYYVYSYSTDASGLTFEQVRDIYTQAIAGGVYKTEKVFEQVASDEYTEKALSGDYSLAPSNSYEMTLTNENVEDMEQTVAGALEGAKADTWAEEVADVGAVAVAGDVALDFAAAQEIPYADVIAGTQVKAESDPSKWQFPLTSFFPFCIPFDVYNMLTAFKADPEAPYYTFKTTVRGVDYGFTIDLSPFDSVAAVLRKLELVAFSIGLAFATNKLIKH